MARGVDDEAAVAEVYANARSLRADEATAAELARQCYRDLFPHVPDDRVAAEVERIVKPVRDAVDAGRSWWAGG
ncbi:hypothetical protein [Skermanella pratensis]|uniref:hypothetical protein n=1 Tax=Skermanella pratensis TaxID=2233999 RepID=UPI0013018CA2|nr:hypothetical protein [Skermanella pratensis]